MAVHGPGSRVTVGCEVGLCREDPVYIRLRSTLVQRGEKSEPIVMKVMPFNTWQLVKQNLRDKCEYLKGVPDRNVRLLYKGMELVNNKKIWDLNLSPPQGENWKPLEALAVWLSGVRDALTVHQCLFFLIRSEAIRYRTLQCFMLNGVIFLGSILLFNLAIDPMLSLLRHFAQDDEAWATEFLAASFSVLYKALWIYPIYCISFVLNTVMYQEIADNALALRLQKTPQATPPFDRLMNETFRVLLNLVYIIEMDLIYYVPVVGPPLFFVHTCWLASLYCFEYSWAHMRWSSNKRLYFFEKHWLYFAGFGFPVSFMSFLCPRFIDSGVFALFFPICILTATVAEPRALQGTPSAARLPVFAAVQGASCLVLRGFECLFSSPARHPPPPGRDQPVGAGAAAGPGQR